MGFAAYIAFYSNDLQRREENCLIGKRPAGNEYSIQDDDWVLDFYWDHRDAEPEALVHDVLKNTKMWDRDLTDIPDLENTVVDSLKMIREQGAENAYLSVL
jgi:tagaturonate reductase